jgi:hypothetical protein
MLFLMRVHAYGALKRGIQHLAECRMRVDTKGQLLHRGARCNGIRALLYQISGVDTNDVDSKQFPTIFIK